MALYDEFAGVYDTVFPLNRETLTFLKGHFSQGRVLDLACGTGNYSIGLAQAGYCVDGYDLDASMVQVAKDKAGALEKVHFVVADMMDLRADAVYDGVFVIGNSLVHLLGDDLIAGLLEKVYRALKKEGTFVIQMINYDRVLDYNVESLPTIERGAVTFHRRYVLEGPVIQFNTQLVVGDEEMVNTVKLWPLRVKRLTELLQRAGFKEIKRYGSFRYDAFDAKRSIPLIVTCVK